MLIKQVVVNVIIFFFLCVINCHGFVFFFFSSRRRHTRFDCDWSSDVCSSDLTLASLYAMGMALSSLYLVYGREADSVNEALHEPVSFLSGVYFPSSLAFPAALQAVVLIIPLAVGMDALQRTLFSLNSTGAKDLTPVYRDLLLIAIMGITLF